MLVVLDRFGFKKVEEISAQRGCPRPYYFVYDMAAQFKHYGVYNCSASQVISNHKIKTETYRLHRYDEDTDTAIYKFDGKE